MSNPYESLIYLYMHVYIDDSMVRVISISDEAYADLSRIKAGRSFTEVIIALVSKRTTAGNFDEVMKFFGALNDKDAASIRKTSKEFRKNFVVRDTNR